MLAVSVFAGGCSAPAPPVSTVQPAAQIVQKLLEMRLARSKDVSAYRLFFRSDSTVPTSLAQAATQEASATKPPIPLWDSPYVSASTTSSADVVVVWKKADAFPEHSLATVFTVARQQERWVILNAREVSSEASIPKAASAGP
jgi:hypothetical protein